MFDPYRHRSRLRRWHHRLTSGNKTRHSYSLIVDIQRSTSPTNHIWLSRRWHPDILSRCDPSHERSDRAELGLTYVDYFSFRPGISVDNSIIRAIVWSVSNSIFCAVNNSIIRIFFRAVSNFNVWSVDNSIIRAFVWSVSKSIFCAVNKF